jgi:L-arabinonolactonase
VAAENLSARVTIQIDPVPVDGDMLGEGPVWDPSIQALYWVDQLGQRVRRFAPATGAYREWKVSQVIACIGLAGASDLVVALADSFCRLDLVTGDCGIIASVPQPRSAVRLSDGRCDRSGRLVAGSAVTDEGEADGAIYRLSEGGSVEVLRRGMMIANAVCFNAAGDRMYYTDSRIGVIMVCDYDPHGNHVGIPREFADTRSHGIGPDGAAVDAEGGVWIAQIVTGQVLRFRADGSFDRCIKLPAPHLSSVCFGGPDLDVLYVTTVRDTRMRIKSDHPQAGRLFAVTGLGVRGVVEGRFGMQGKKTTGT